MLERVRLLGYVGSVLPEHHGSKLGTHAPPIDNATTEAPHAPPGASKGDYFSELYMIIVIILSTLLPLICVILSAVFVRKLWVKLHDHPSTTATVQREDTAQTSIKSSREINGSRKSSRGGSRVSKSDPTSRDQLVAQLHRRPVSLTSRRRSSSYLVFQDYEDEESFHDNHRSYVNSPLIDQDDVIEASLEDPIILVADDDAIPSTSQEGLQKRTTIDIEDDGGFGARAKFRNHSLKVDMEGSLHRTNHHRSYSDVGKNRRKSEQVELKPQQSKEEVVEVVKPKKSSNFLVAPGPTGPPGTPTGTKIRKSHSMRYRTETSGSSPVPGARPRVAQDDCMGDLKRTSLEPEILITSPRLQHRRSPHQFYQQQHHPQVHQQPTQSSHQPLQPHSGQGHSPIPPHHSSQGHSPIPPHHSSQGHSPIPPHHSSQGHSPIPPHHSSQGHSPIPPHHSSHQQPVQSNQQAHLSHQQSYPGNQQPHSSHPPLHSTQQQSLSSQHQRRYSVRRREPDPPPEPEPELEMPEEFADLTLNQVEELIQQQQQETETGNFGMTTSDLSLDENGTSNNPSYQYGNQPPNQYPPLSKVQYYGGFYGYPVTTISYPTTDTHQRRLVVAGGHQPSGSSPTRDDDERLESASSSAGRKKSLTNAFEFSPPPETRPMPPVLSPRGLLSKQYSLPAAARDPRQLKGGSTRQRHHTSLRHDPAPQRLFQQAAPTLTRHSSARERPVTGGNTLVARRTVSSGGNRLLASRNSGSFNLGSSISPRSPQPPSIGGATSPRPRGRLSHSRTISSPTAHLLPDDQLQYI